MRFALTVTGPAYGTQQAAARQFAEAVLQEGHELACVFSIAKACLTLTS